MSDNEELKTSSSFSDKNEKESLFDERIFNDYDKNVYRQNSRENFKSISKLKTMGAINAMGDIVRDSVGYVDETVTNIIYDDCDEQTKKEAEARRNKRKKMYHKIISILVLVFSILYFLFPADLFPDVIPIIGYIEDVAFLLFAFKQFSSAFS